MKLSPVTIDYQSTDVLVIGSGGAGLRCAIELHDHQKKVIVVGKCKKREAHTTMAQGGINAALKNMDSKDSWQLHAADTIADGGYINDPIAVSILCKHAPAAIAELESWGCPFHREKNGKITQRFFGAATYRRACFVGDVTGKAILNTLVDQVEKRSIEFQSEIYIVSLLDTDGIITGALGLNMRKGSFIVYTAKSVVLATGGHSRMFARSSSHFWENTGDGIALGSAYGATCMDMEMFQFHPTGMIYPKKMSGLLVTEAVRGEGGILTNSKGERYMKKYDKQRLELSARDIVARANYMEIEKGRGSKRGGVYLDISHLDLKYIKKRLPTMYSRFKKFANIDISKKKMEVAPTAHYSMGGLEVDHKTCKTSVPNLYAVGEVTGGVHGGNRLGGNSLAEICVFGKICGQQIIDDLSKSPNKSQLSIDNDQVDSKVYDLIIHSEQSKGINPIKAKEELQQIMWECAGVIRNEKNLKRGLQLVEKFKNMQLKTSGGLRMNEALIAMLDLQNMIPACEMILHSALIRKESRAAHYRSDYTKTSGRWKKNILCKNTGKKIVYSSKKIAEIPSQIQKKLDWKQTQEQKNHLLE